MLLLFKFTRNVFQNYLTGGWVTGLIVFAIGLAASWFIKETYGKDLDFTEV
jgi:putative MFS transporter